MGGLEEVVRIKDLHEGTKEAVPKVATGADQRALGVQVNMEGTRAVLWGRLVLR